MHNLAVKRIRERRPRGDAGYERRSDAGDETGRASGAGERRGPAKATVSIVPSIEWFEGLLYIRNACGFP